MRTTCASIITVALLVGSAIGVTAQEKGAATDGAEGLSGQAASDMAMEAWATAMSGEFTAQVRRNGRGERARADTPSPSLVIPVSDVPSYVHRDWKTA